MDAAAENRARVRVKREWSYHPPPQRLQLGVLKHPASLGAVPAASEKSPRLVAESIRGASRLTRSPALHSPHRWLAVLWMQLPMPMQTRKTWPPASPSSVPPCSSSSPCPSVHTPESSHCLLGTIGREHCLPRSLRLHVRRCDHILEPGWCVVERRVGTGIQSCCPSRDARQPRVHQRHYP